MLAHDDIASEIVAVTLVLAGVLLAAPARAAPPAYPCPYMSLGWSQNWSTGPISSVAYTNDYQVLFVVFAYKTVSAYSDVPISVMQTFSQSRDPQQVYQTQVVPRYHALLLAESSNCPILVEDAQNCPLRNENGTILLSQVNAALLNETEACPLPKYPVYVWTK